MTEDLEEVQHREINWTGMVDAQLRRANSGPSPQKRALAVAGLFELLDAIIPLESQTRREWNAVMNGNFLQAAYKQSPALSFENVGQALRILMRFLNELGLGIRGPAMDPVLREERELLLELEVSNGE